MAAASAAAGAAAPSDLTSLSLEQLMSLQVVGASKYEQRQADTPAAVSIITAQEIKAFGWRTLDEALASLPGVFRTYDRQYAYLGTRGFGVPGDFNTRVLVTVNGNRLNDPTFDGGPFGNQLPLSLALVDRIEFVPGPGGAVYGQNAMFGVINIITRDGAQLGGTEVALAYQHPQSTRDVRLSFGRRLDNGLDLVVSASHLRSRGDDRFYQYGASGISGVAEGLDGARDTEWYARLGMGPWRLDLISGSHRKFDPTGAYLSDPLVPGQYQGDAYALGNLHYEQSFAGDTLHLSARLFAGQEKYSSQLSYGTLFSFPATSKWHGGEVRLLSTAWDGHKLLLGLEAQDDRRRLQEILDLEQPANNLRIADDGYRVGVYLQDEWRLADALTATLGMRVDRNDSTGTKTSPRMALIWHAQDSTTLKFLAGRAHRAPNAYESKYEDGFAQLANRALGGERIDTVEVVADHRIGKDTLLRAAAYQWSMRDIVTLGAEPVSGIPQYQSGDPIKARGLELSADRTWDGGSRLRGSVSLQRAASEGGRTLVNSPKWLGKLNWSTPLPWVGLRLAYEWRYDSSRLTQDGSRLGGYAVSNLSLSTDSLLPGVEMSLLVSNALDKRFAHPGAETNWQSALEQDGRSVRASFTYRF